MGINTPRSDKEIYEEYKPQIKIYLSDKIDSLNLRNKVINKRNIPPEIIWKDVLFMREENRNSGFFGAFDKLLSSTLRINYNNEQKADEYLSLMGSLLNIFKSGVQSELQKSISETAKQKLINELNLKKEEIKKSSIREIKYKIRSKLRCTELILENMINKFNRYTKKYIENKFFKFDLNSAQERAFDDIKKEYKISKEGSEDIKIMLICLQEKHGENPEGEQLNLF